MKAHTFITSPYRRNLVFPRWAPLTCADAVISRIASGFWQLRSRAKFSSLHGREWAETVAKVIFLSFISVKILHVIFINTSLLYVSFV